MSGDGASTARIGIAQYAIPDGDACRNEARVLDHVERLCAMDCDVIALPELCLTPYFPAARDESAFSLARATDDPFVRSVAALAHQHATDILLPIFEDAGGAVYYNTVLHFGRDGRLSGRYRKTHVPAVRSFEKYYFRPGAALAPLTATWGTFGCLLCQDRFFPEASRILALSGARIIFTLNASADYAGFAEMWLPIHQTRAYENGCFVVAVNRTGQEGENRFFGQSVVIGPDGSVLASAGADESAFVTEIDLDEVRTFRNSIQMYRDYRPEIYGRIASFEDMHDE